MGLVRRSGFLFSGSLLVSWKSHFIEWKCKKLGQVRNSGSMYCSLSNLALDACIWQVGRQTPMQPGLPSKLVNWSGIWRMIHTIWLISSTTTIRNSVHPSIPFFILKGSRLFIRLFELPGRMLSLNGGCARSVRSAWIISWSWMRATYAVFSKSMLNTTTMLVLTRALTKAFLCRGQ